MGEDFKPYKTDPVHGDNYKHPTFGVIQFCRYSSSHGQPMFGSSILHNNGIQLTISHAELVRSNNNDHAFPTHTIVEVNMSATQFADAITNMNNGGGTPVTIRLITKSDGENLTRTDPPYTSKVAQFNEEFDKDIKELGERFDSVISLANETHAQKRLIRELELLKGHFVSNIPFVNEQFSEQMEKTVTEAKAEIEAFVDMTIHQHGVEAIRQQAPRLQEADSMQIKRLKEGNET